MTGGSALNGFCNVSLTVFGRRSQHYTCFSISPLHLSEDTPDLSVLGQFVPRVVTQQPRLALQRVDAYALLEMKRTHLAEILLVIHLISDNEPQPFVTKPFLA